MHVMKWNFNLNDDGVVSFQAVGDDEASVPDDWHEEIKPGGNFCGVKYAALMAAKRGVLEVSWLQFAKWREER